MKRFNKFKRLKKTIPGLFAIFVFSMLAFMVIPRPPLNEGLTFSKAVYDREGTLLRLTLAADQRYRLKTPLSSVSPHLIEATLAYEDRHYFSHPGVNPFSLGRAAWQTYVGGQRRVGGSTLTMQVARMRFGLKTNTLGGKLIQVLRALQLERHYSKKQILAAYFTLAPYGGNIEGAGAAALIYFGKSSKQLNLPQSLALSVVPQNPVKRSPPGREELKIALPFYLSAHPEASASQPAFALPLAPLTKKALPFLAPHFVQEILSDSSDQGEILTSLDLQQQSLMERTIKAFINRKKSLGVKNAVALLADARTMEVRAMVGSANFFNDAIHGQVNGTNALRSPGSTLKPFLYALALDQGLIHPMTVLKDTPKGYGLYEPENFDGSFQGPVTVQDALIRSRNVPAVWLSNQLQKPTLYTLLKAAKIPRLKSEKHYGLSLVLGGGEVRARDLVRLYAMLANGGILRPLRFQLTSSGTFDSGTRHSRGSGREAGLPLLSPEAAFLTLNMLTKNPRPDFQTEWAKNKIPVAWKTGTSYGYRDAWAVGVFGPYVLAVWVGNFDGAGRQTFVGRKIAGPLFFALTDALINQGEFLPSLLSPIGLNLRRLEVCAASGGLPGPHCPVRVPTWFIPGKSPITPDTVFREIRIEKTTGLRSCGYRTKGTVGKVFEFWPSDLLQVFREAGIPRRSPPPFKPGCQGTATGLPPEITSPKKGVSVTLQPATGKAIPLSAVTEADVVQVFWFSGRDYLGAAPAGESFFWKARPGTHMLRVVDDQGRASNRKIQVLLLD